MATISESDLFNLLHQISQVDKPNQIRLARELIEMMEPVWAAIYKNTSKGFARELVLNLRCDSEDHVLGFLVLVKIGGCEEMIRLVKKEMLEFGNGAFKDLVEIHLVEFEKFEASITDDNQPFEIPLSLLEITPPPPSLPPASQQNIPTPSSAPKTNTFPQSSSAPKPFSHTTNPPVPTTSTTTEPSSSSKRHPDDVVIEGMKGLQLRKTSPDLLQSKGKQEGATKKDPSTSSAL